MQKLLTSAMTTEQAEIYSWLALGIKNISVGVNLDSMVIEDDYRLEFNNVAFQQFVDGTWGSYARYDDCDEEGDHYTRDGELIVYSQTDFRSLVYRTLTDMATDNLAMAFEYQAERVEKERQTYQPCAFPKNCGCWQCRHRYLAPVHQACCALCRNADFSRYPVINEEIPF